MLSAAAVTGCIRDNDDCPTTKEGYVSISLEWGNVTPPEKTLFYFYGGQQDGPIIREGTSEGYQGMLPEGVYNVVISHAGMQGASYRINGSYYEDEVVAVQRTRAVSNLSDIYGAGIEGVEVKRDEISKHSVAPRNFVRKVTFNVPAQEGLNSVEIEIAGIVYSARAFDGKLYTLDSEKLRTPLTATADGFSAEISVLGFLSPTVVRTWADFDGHGTIESLPQDITDEIEQLGEQGGVIDLEITFPNGASINMGVEIQPWGPGQPGNGTVE